MRPQFIVLPASKLQICVHLFAKLNSLLSCDVLFFLRFYSAARSPSGSCQGDVWSCSMLKAARCLFSLSFQPSHNNSLPYNSPERCVLTAIPLVGAQQLQHPSSIPVIAKGVASWAIRLLQRCNQGDWLHHLWQLQVNEGVMLERNKGCSLIEEGYSYISLEPWPLLRGWLCCMMDATSGSRQVHRQLVVPP